MSLSFFKKNGYVLVKNLLNKELRDFITQYALFDEMQNFSNEYSLYKNNAQVPNAHSKYADPAMESLLLHIKPKIEEATGLTLYPTYSFYRVYRNGDSLSPHKDRESCEISTTICFNYSYDDNHYTWPIVMDGNKINMEPGDVVIYRGTDLEHSRETFTPPGDHWHVQAFLHYVDANGPYKEFIYDKRDSVGRAYGTKRYIERS